MPGVMWLDFAALQAFETAYRRWLVCRRLWLRRPSDALAGQLDQAAAAVLSCLTPSHEAAA